MNNNLFICFQRGFIKRKNIPLTDDIILFDTYDLLKKTKFSNISEWRKLDYLGIPFPPAEANYQFPKELYLVFKKKQTDFQFNYLEYGSDVKILSVDLFNALGDNGLSKEQYECAALQLVDKSGNQLSEKKYCALRFGNFNDEQFIFNKQTAVKTKINGSTNYLYPDLALKQSIPRNIFMLKEFSYRNSFIIAGIDTATALAKKFTDLDIYSIKDFPFIYQNQYNEDELPVNNRFTLTH